MKEVVHLIPYWGIGGVERAAATMVHLPVSDNIIFEVKTIFPRRIFFNFCVFCNIKFYLTTIKDIFVSNPDYLIVSLWRSYIVGIIIKIFRPQMKLVAFLHYPLNIHLLDKFLSKILLFLSYAIFADSYQTLIERIGKSSKRKTYIISYLIEETEPSQYSQVTPSFCFWGRLHRQKGLSSSLLFFHKIHQMYPQSMFYIIGPDGGELVHLEKLVNSLNLGEAVRFLGEMNFSEIVNTVSRFSFYLQLSEMEGAALSVIEAMQLGLIPIVTPVGEIMHYCIDGFNSIIVNDEFSAISEIQQLINNDNLYRAIRKHSISTWQQKTLYKDDILSAIKSLDARYEEF